MYLLAHMRTISLMAYLRTTKGCQVQLYFSGDLILVSEFRDLELGVRITGPWLSNATS